MAKPEALERVESRILVVRGQRVMVDRDLARLYGVPAKVLNQAVRRNVSRFPEDFMFQLDAEEYECLRSQFVTLDNQGRGAHRKYLPYAFTEQGVAMLSSVLRSPRAIQVNIEIMRAFVRLREYALSHSELARRIESLEIRYDEHFRVVFDAIRELMMPEASPRTTIGFDGG